MGFDIMANDYNGALSQEYGVRISVHAAGVFGYPQTDGITIAPGAITYLSLK